MGYRERAPVAGPGILAAAGLLVLVWPLLAAGIGSVEPVQAVESVTGLQCPPCEQIHCVPRRPDRLKCRGGVTLGVCLCCPVCAKVEGEMCGGQWNYLGKCDRGFFCQVQENQLWQHKTNDGELLLYQNKKGVCTKLAPDMYNSDQAHASYCQPKCAADFCLKNPKAICAAIDNAERKRDCQNPCQHTSCSACRFVPPEPDCIKCSTDDFPCMRRYAKCVRKQFCHKHRFPCKKMTQVEPADGKFMCMVPECLDSNHASAGSRRSPATSLLPSNLV